MNIDLPSDQRCLILVEPKEKLAYCRIPKVGSSIWLSRFHSLLSGEPPGTEQIDQSTLNSWSANAQV